MIEVPDRFKEAQAGEMKNKKAIKGYIEHACEAGMPFHAKHLPKTIVSVGYEEGNLKESALQGSREWGKK